MIEITGKGKSLIARILKENYENEVQIFSYIDHSITFTDFFVDSRQNSVEDFCNILDNFLTNEKGFSHLVIYINPYLQDKDFLKNQLSKLENKYFGITIIFIS